MKNKQELTQLVISKLDAMLDLSEYPLDASFEDLGMDSLDEVEFIMALEDELDILIPDKVAESTGTIEETVNYLLSLPNER